MSRAVRFSSFISRDSLGTLGHQRLLLHQEPAALLIARRGGVCLCSTLLKQKWSHQFEEAGGMLEGLNSLGKGTYELLQVGVSPQEGPGGYRLRW